MNGAKTAAAEANALWAAAGDARAWKAAMHDHAAWKERRKAWAIKAEADESMRRASKACRRAAKAPDRMDAAAAWRVSARISRAADAFRRSSRLSRAAGVELLRASKAYMRAGGLRRAVAASKRAPRSYDHAIDASGLAICALDGTEALLRDSVKMARGSTRLAEGAAGSSEEGGVRDGIRGALSSARENLRGDSGWARTLSEASKEDLGKAERRTVKARRLAADASERSAAGAAAAAGRGLDDPGVQRAAAAWNKARAAADKGDGRWEAARAVAAEKRPAGRATQGRRGAAAARGRGKSRRGGDECDDMHDST